MTRARRRQKGLTVVSTFAGTGGSSLGYKQAGCDIRLAVEWEDHAAQCYRDNYPDTELYHGDIAKLSVEEALDLAGLLPGELDILDGSPPCFAAGTPVLTWRGFVPIEEVGIGDRVLTHKGNWRRVTRVMTRIAEKTILVDRRIETTPDHRFWTRGHNRRGTPGWTPARNVAGLACATPASVPGAEIPPAPSGFTYSAGFWYFVGRWLGDGWLRIDPGDPSIPRVRFPQHEKPVPCVSCGRPSMKHSTKNVYTNYCSGGCQREYKSIRRRPRHEVLVCAGHHEAESVGASVRALGVAVGRSVQKTTERFSISRKSLAEWLLEWFGRGAADKTMPGWVLGMRRLWRAELLRGYMEADGPKITTISRCLSVAASVLASTLGKTSCIEGPYHYENRTIEGRPVTTRPAYGVRIRDDDGRFTTVEGCLRWKKIRRKNREGRNTVRVYDLTVEEDHSFFADLFAVHNCQGFSTAGKRAFNDDRNQLFREYVRLIDGLRPRAFVMENVSGMVKGKMRLIFVECLKALKAAGDGYRVSARILNACYFGVPQARMRLIIIGLRNDLGVEPSHPRPTTEPIALQDVFPHMRATRSMKINPWIDARKPAATLCKNDSDYQVLTDVAEDERQLVGIKSPSHMFKFKLFPADRPGPTLTKDCNGYLGQIDDLRCRPLTVEEGKAIQGFPQDFILRGSRAQCWARIGNSVPPPLTRAVAEHIARILPVKPKRRKRSKAV